MIKLIAYGEPVAKGRPKVAIRGKYATIYTPKQTRDAENELISKIIHQKPQTPITGAISVNIKFFKKKPKSYGKSVTHWTTKPDIDNICKLVLDSLNKVFIKDDAEITELNLSKEYDETPRTEIIIEEKWNTNQKWKYQYGKKDVGYATKKEDT